MSGGVDVDPARLEHRENGTSLTFGSTLSLPFGPTPAEVPASEITPILVGSRGHEFLQVMTCGHRKHVEHDVSVQIGAVDHR